jgi:hypothetical protein
VPGTLTIDGDELLLDLFGYPPPDSEPDERGVMVAPFMTDYELLYGAGADGNRYTLTSCSYRGQHIGSGAGLLLTLKPRMAFVGKTLLEQPFETQFTGALVEFTGLIEWVGHTLAQLTVDDHMYPRDVTITHRSPDPIVASVDFGTVTLQHAPTYSNAGRAELEDHASFLIEPAEPQTFEELMSGPIRVLQHFLTFVTDAASTVSTLHLHLPEADADRGYARWRAQFESSADPLLGTDPTQRSMMFPGDRFRDRIGSMIERWFAFVAQVELVADVLLAARYRPRIFGETRFLFTVQACEALHRQHPQFSSYNRTREEFKRWRDRVLEHVPEGDRAEVKRQLQNNKTLRAQILEISSAAPFVADELALNMELVTRRASKARHEIVHTLDRTVDADELYMLSETLRWIMNGYLLQTIGLSADEIKYWLHTKAGLGQLAQLWRDHPNAGTDTDG